MLRFLGEHPALPRALEVDHQSPFGAVVPIFGGVVVDLPRKAPDLVLATPDGLVNRRNQPHPIVSTGLEVSFPEVLYELLSPISPPDTGRERVVFPPGRQDFRIAVEVESEVMVSLQDMSYVPLEDHVVIDPDKRLWNIGHVLEEDVRVGFPFHPSYLIYSRNPPRPHIGQLGNYRIGHVLPHR